MRDPARLLDEGATSAELSLLRAGMSEEPSAEAMKRLSAALGLASGAAVSTFAFKTSAAGSVVRGALSKFATKWVLMGAFGVVSAAALVLGHQRDVESPRRDVRAPSYSLAAGTAPVAPVAPAAPTAPETSTATSEPPAVNSGPSPTSAVAALQAPSRGSPSIAREIAALDVARRLLGTGNARGALRALDDYDRVAPSGVLRQEATLLRIEVSARAGDMSTSRRLAARFLREHPGSPHEKRIRALAGETP